ncbi:hypothetical protein IAR55_005531 [Kwoniella newhampshirensis]|uniref:F-box domain-containing protein n=1 Tax=Kwoniella newhampshirensis TaxID=1651941 RepID=A0AAW0YVR5_9TREE
MDDHGVPDKVLPVQFLILDHIKHDYPMTVVTASWLSEFCKPDHSSLRPRLPASQPNIAALHSRILTFHIGKPIMDAKTISTYFKHLPREVQSFVLDYLKHFAPLTVLPVNKEIYNEVIPTIYNRVVMTKDNVDHIFRGLVIPGEFRSDDEFLEPFDLGHLKKKAFESIRILIFDHWEAVEQFCLEIMHTDQNGDQILLPVIADIFSELEHLGIGWKVLKEMAKAVKARQENEEWADRWSETDLGYITDPGDDGDENQSDGEYDPDEVFDIDFPPFLDQEDNFLPVKSICFDLRGRAQVNLSWKLVSRAIDRFTIYGENDECSEQLLIIHVDENAKLQLFPSTMSDYKRVEIDFHTKRSPRAFLICLWNHYLGLVHDAALSKDLAYIIPQTENLEEMLDGISEEFYNWESKEEWDRFRKRLRQRGSKDHKACPCENKNDFILAKETRTASADPLAPTAELIDIDDDVDIVDDSTVMFVEADDEYFFLADTDDSDSDASGSA